MYRQQPMAMCPTCGSLLEKDLTDASSATFVCLACRTSLQPRRALAAALQLPDDSEDLRPAVDRFGQSVGACPACEGGQLAPARLLGEALAVCSGCAAAWINREQLLCMRARLGRERAKRSAMLRLESDQERRADTNRFAFDDLQTNRFAYPAALAVGVLTHLLGLSFLVWGTVEMWFHELGHAFLAWLSGFVAVPLPFFTILPREERSGWVIAITLGMIGAVLYESAKRRWWGLVTFGGVLAVAELLLTFVLNPARAMQWVLFAGQAGAIVLPTLVMLAFYQPLGWRWDFWRYPAIVLAAVGLVHALFIWVGVARGMALMPHGSALGDECNGDMERLVRDFHWTKTSLASTYVGLSFACLCVLGAAYLVFLHRAIAKQANQGRG